MLRRVKSLAGALGLAVVALAGPAVAGNRVVVELFTSQGCSSCPPADAFLGELARRDDLIALSFHVDYWNYLGWRDPFSSAAATARQRGYQHAFDLRYVYTPQMVIGGAVQAVGSDRAAVLRAIAGQRDRDPVPVAVALADDGTATIRIGAGPRQAKPATVWAFVFDRAETTVVKSGENRGAKLTTTNVVRAVRTLGAWTGTPATFHLAAAAPGMAGHDGCAIVVQRAGQGAILGAALIRPGKSG